MTATPDHLDTNILVWAVRGGATWQHIKAVCDPLMVLQRPTISVVSQGEMLSLAGQFSWGDLKNSQMRYLLQYFVTLDINRPEILIAYAAIDHYSHNQGIKMGKNDLWIAATAHIAGARLITTDADFDHLHGIFLKVLRVPVS